MERDLAHDCDSFIEFFAPRSCGIRWDVCVEPYNFIDKLRVK